MEAIWNPPNKHALPTPHETEIVKESISSLESQLEGAIAIFEQAQSNLAALKQQIRDRKAWISAVRRILHDVISIIFLDVCDDNRSAPLFLGHVCRVWRESIHATPRAWSHIPLYDICHKDFISCFLDRSKPVPLQIGIDEATSISSWEHLVHSGAMRRTKELAVSLPHHLKVLQQPLPILERLGLCHRRSPRNPFNNTVVEPPGYDLGFFFSAFNFPHLRSLEVEASLDSTSWTSAPFAVFVPLQVLTIESPDPAIWTMVVIGCSRTLKSLTVTLIDDWGSNNIAQFEREAVEFPSLERLSIYDENHHLSAWVLNAVTPKLRWYDEDTSNSDLEPLHADIATVTSVSIQRKTNLAAYSGIQQLHATGEILIWVMETLASNPELCPNLTTLVNPSWDSLNSEELSHCLTVLNNVRGNEFRVTKAELGPLSIRDELTDWHCGLEPHWTFLRKRGSSLGQ